MTNKKHRILGIDPGTNVLGYSIIQVNNKTLTLIEFGVVTMKHLPSHQLKLRRIFERLQELIAQHSPSQVAIEAPFFGKNVQSMLKLGRAQGVAIAAAITKDIEVTEYSPKKIKQSVTGNGNASKEQVAAMLCNILHEKFDDKMLDATDALATAVCHYYQSSSLLSGKTKYNDWSNYAKDNPGRVS